MADQTTPPWWDDVNDALGYAEAVMGLADGAASPNVAARINTGSQPKLATVSAILNQAAAEVCITLVHMGIDTTVPLSTQALLVVQGHVARLFGCRVIQAKVAAAQGTMPEGITAMLTEELDWHKLMREDPEQAKREGFALQCLGATASTCSVTEAMDNAWGCDALGSNWTDRNNTDTFTYPPENDMGPRIEPTLGGINEPQGPNGTFRNIW